MGTCSNIEVEIDVIDESPFFIRLYHVKARGQKIYRQGNEAFMLFRHIEGRICSLLQPSHVNE